MSVHPDAWLGSAGYRAASPLSRHAAIQHHEFHGAWSPVVLRREISRNVCAWLWNAVCDRMVLAGIGIRAHVGADPAILPRLSPG
jgi:hypothetical protein